MPKLRVSDVFNVLSSIGVDFQVSKRITKEQLKLYVKFKNKLKKKLSNDQKKLYRAELDYITEIINDLSTYIKSRDERKAKIILDLEDNLLDLSELDKMDKKFEDYKKWRAGLKFKTFEQFKEGENGYRKEKT